jgi:23S rRNA pseudouridine1911/1915/1917 synthase
MEKIEFRVEAAHAGRRLDAQASEMSGLSRSRLQRLIAGGLLRVNGRVEKQNYRTKAGDVIVLSIPPAGDEGGLTPEDIPVEVLFMDDSLAVVDKPAGMVVYPAAGHRSGTLLNALAYRAKRLASVGGPLRPGVVHRLDKDTSGVMVVALDDAAYYDLVEQFRKRSIQRRYEALVYGSLKADAGEISAKIGRSESERKKMSTRSRRGKEAVTRWRVIERFPAATLVEARLGTGRTHQIRVHFASVGHPVLGDKTYGKKTVLEVKKEKIFFPRQMLHAELLGFIHPEAGRYMEFTSPLPPDMRQKIDALRGPR